MNRTREQELRAAIDSNAPLTDVVALLRKHKEQGAGQREVYTFLETLRRETSDEGLDDRILEIADFVAGFCAPHMRIWDSPIESSPRNRSA